MIEKLIRMHSVFTPLLIAPIAYFLWLGFYGGDHKMVILTMIFPITYAYVIPFIGIKVLNLWQINSKTSNQGWRPQSGFIFGSFASLFTILVMEKVSSPADYGQILKICIINGSLIGFWNWIFEIYAMKRGFIVFKSLTHENGGSPEEVATEYAPISFGFNGFFMALVICLNQIIIQPGNLSGLAQSLIIALEMIIYLSAPLIIFFIYRKKTKGHFYIMKMPKINSMRMPASLMRLVFMTTGK